MAPATSAENGRNGLGRFTPGNAYAKGNPQAKRMLEYRRAFLDATSADDVVKVSRKLKDLAVDGDLVAIRLYLSYAIGAPVQAVELSGPDGAPLALDLGRLEACIVAAVEPFGPDVRFAVASALRGVAVAGRDEPARDPA